MKILYVSTISNTLNAFLIPHIRLLVEQGHTVDIACNIVQDIDPELIKLCSKIHNVEFQRSPLSKSNFTAFGKIKRIVFENNYELIHTHTPVASFLTRLACRDIPNLKLFYTAHGFHFYKGAPLKNWLIYFPIEWICARWTDGIITMNEEDFLSAQKIKNKRCIHKVHGVGIDIKRFIPQTAKLKEQFRKEYGFNNRDFILLYAGELSYRKNQELLINTVHILKHRIPNIKLLLAGTGELLEIYQKQVSRLGLEKHVEFLGYRKDIDKLMLLSDIAVSSSRQEGLPVNVMEAMATALPVIVTNCRGNRDLVINGENGYIVELNDDISFADSIERLYASENLRVKFGRRSISLIQQYKQESVLKETNKILINQF